MKYTERQMYAVKLYAVSFRLYRAGTIAAPGIWILPRVPCRAVTPRAPNGALFIVSRNLGNYAERQRVY